MGTTNNFDSPASTAALAAGDTMPVIRAATGRAATVTAAQTMAITGRTRYYVLEGSHGTLASLGTSAVATANATYVSSILIPHPMLISGIGFLNGGSAATDRLIYSLWSAAGAPLANTTLASAGTVAANANVFQEIALTAAYQVTKPGLFWIVWQANGTTTTRRSIATATWLNVNTLAAGAAGGAGTLPATITPPTTFTADTGPIGYVVGA
jgi:hypothetical protein